MGKTGMLALAAVFVFLFGCIFEGEGGAGEIPEERMALSLPFGERDVPNSLIPMGETLEHPKPANPHGRPWIEFLWYNDVGPEKRDVIASAGGEVVAVSSSGVGDERDISVRSGEYIVQYGHLEPVNRNLSAGVFVERGDYLGKSASLHWAFGYYMGFEGGHAEYLCPLAYMDAESREALEGIPVMYEMREAGFVEACSGDYAGKNK